MSTEGVDLARSETRQTAVLAAVATIGQFSTSIYVPSIPTMAADLGAPVALLQLTIAAYLVPVALGQLVMGAAADRVGRRRVLIAGMLVFLVGTIVCLAATNVASLFVGRVLQGVGGAAGLVVSRAVARDLFEGDALVRAVSTIAAAFAIVPGITPLVGGIIDDALGWRFGFGLTLVLGAILLVTYFRLVPESLAPGTTRSFKALGRGYLQLFADRGFQRHAIVSAGPIAGIFAFLAGGPVMAVAEQGLSASRFGLYPPLATTGFLLFNRLASRRLKSLGAPRLVQLGLILTLAGSLLALGLRAADRLEINGLTFCMWLFSGGMGVVVPLSTAQAMQLHPDRAGSAAAVIGFEQMLGGIFAALGVAALTPALGSLGFPLVMTVAAILSGFAFVALNQRH